LALEGKTTRQAKVHLLIIGASVDHWPFDDSMTINERLILTAKQIFTVLSDALAQMSEFLLFVPVLSIRHE
jgi:hypothetical protein